MDRFEIQRHVFTAEIINILKNHFGDYAEDIFEASSLLGYLNNKTKSANRGSKARGAFANHYALYVLVEDYIKKGFYDRTASISHSKYEGARFSDLLKRQRELPFGAKLQNHALNARLNDEFKKFYPSVGVPSIVRDIALQRYWIREDLLLVTILHKDGQDFTYNIALVIIEVIDAYVATKKAAFEEFLEACYQMVELGQQNPGDVADFVVKQLQPNVDARVFEIVSYAVLKAKYGQEIMWIGKTKDSVMSETLVLYKTGRTNANDGGIDFVMKPLGRFFQVTESLDVNKYFLDIDKVQRFPITFVVKSLESTEKIHSLIRMQAITKYKIEAIVDVYMKALEEIINVNDLISAFDSVVKAGQLQQVMDEIILQSKVEFNYVEFDYNDESDGDSEGEISLSDL
jgi:hypothetical protein